MNDFVPPLGTLILGNHQVVHGLFRQVEKRETIMPVLLVPLLVGIPVVLGGGYVIYHLVH